MINSPRGASGARFFVAVLLVHATLTFLLFMLVFALPKSGLMSAVGAATDVLLQPFLGPHAVLPSPGSSLRFANGVLVYLATSATWALALTAVRAAVTRLNRGRDVQRAPH